MLAHECRFSSSAQEYLLFQHTCLMVFHSGEKETDRERKRENSLLTCHSPFFVHVCAEVSVFVSDCVRACACVCVRVRVCMCLRVRVCVCERQSVCMFYMNIYIFLHTYAQTNTHNHAKHVHIMHTHTHTHTQTHTFLSVTHYRSMYLYMMYLYVMYLYACIYMHVSPSIYIDLSV